ncbi:MAG TPA: NAD-dependent epimerase/dehydratase family protein [Candidatus Paceibacterota bacterium]
MKKCLVIGGNGFIGKNIVLELLKNQYSVVVFDIVTNNIKEAVIEYDNIHFIEGDINNTTYLTEQIKYIDCVVWLIHTTVPATSMYDVEFDLLSNIPPLLRFIQYLLHGSTVKKFIYLSSGGTVYGNPAQNNPIDESFNKNPISSYGLTKLIAEEYLTFLTKNSKIDSFILRPSNVYGRYQNLKKPQGLIGHVFKSIIVNEPITIFGDGTIVRDYVHVTDLSKAIISCIEYKDNINYPLVLNIASGQPTSINDIIQNATSITGKQVKIVANEAREFDCKYNVLSIEKAFKTINWSPEIDIKTGMQDEWIWIQNDLK